jgi:hypothetical protein
MGDRVAVDLSAGGPHHGLELARPLGRFDESYVHAILVELCDGIRLAAPRAQVDVVAIPKPDRMVTPCLVVLWRQCNAAAEVTARLRGFVWRSA